jgi:hypothetical protein
MAAKRHYGSEFYTSVDSKRRLEAMDAGMIHEDPNAIANLPQNWMVKPYPKTQSLSAPLDDTIRGIDRQMGIDVSKARKQLRPQKS